MVKVGCDDFRAAMADASGVVDGLAQFERWYLQAGTPTVTFEGFYDEATGSYKATLTQRTAPTPGQASVTLVCFFCFGEPPIHLNNKQHHILRRRCTRPINLRRHHHNPAAAAGLWWCLFRLAADEWWWWCLFRSTGGRYFHLMPVPVGGAGS